MYWNEMIVYQFNCHLSYWFRYRVRVRTKLTSSKWDLNYLECRWNNPMSIQGEYTEESYGQDVCCCWRSINQSWFDQLLLFIPSLLFWKLNLSTVLERKAKIQLSPWPPSPQESDNCLRNLRWQQQHTRPTIERDSSANGTCQLQTTTLVASSNQDKKLTNFDDSCFFFFLFIIVAQTCSRGEF